jgi:hypothetical protein
MDTPAATAKTTSDPATHAVMLNIFLRAKRSSWRFEPADYRGQTLNP